MTNQNLKIELLYFNDCPFWKNALDVLMESLDVLRITQNVSLVPVETQEGAEKYKFTGSPMIKVNGIDLFPTGQANYALGCRVYQTPQGYKGWPTKETLSEKLQPFVSVK